MLSLPDWAFYPTATAAAAGMIAAAVSFGDSNHRTTEEIRAEGLLVEGEALSALVTGNGLVATFLEADGTRFVQISAARGPLDGPQSAGAFYALSDAELRAFEGHRLRITYQLRSSSADGANTALLNLFTPDRGQAAWEEVALSNDFTSVELDVHSAACSWPQAYLALWPDWANNANTIDMASVRITALEATPCD